MKRFILSASLLSVTTLVFAKQNASGNIDCGTTDHCNSDYDKQAYKEQAELNGEFVQPLLEPGEMRRLEWKEDGKLVDPYINEIGLPEMLQPMLLDYAERNGFLDRFKDLVGEHPFPIDSWETEKMNGLWWSVQRTTQKYFSNMHWIGPHDKEANEDLLKVFGSTGFDKVVDGLARNFGLKTATVMHPTFIAVSDATGHFFHYDFSDTGGKAFNIIIPLIDVPGAGPELTIMDDLDDEKIGGYKYRKNHAMVFGDDGMHCTAKAHYEEGYRLGITIFVAEITEENVKDVISGYSQAYPPQNDPQWALDHAGLHYGRGFRLPRSEDATQVSGAFPLLNNIRKRIVVHKS